MESGYKGIIAYLPLLHAWCFLSWYRLKKIQFKFDKNDLKRKCFHFTCICKELDWSADGDYFPPMCTKKSIVLYLSLIYYFIDETVGGNLGSEKRNRKEGKFIKYQWNDYYNQWNDYYNILEFISLWIICNL